MFFYGCSVNLQCAKVFKTAPARIARVLLFFRPRGFGKSTWLRQALPNAAFFDLLDAALYL